MVVVLVEDDLLIQGILAESLEEAGYRTETAEDVEQALDLIERTQAELWVLVTDIRIPSGDGRTGWDVAQHARELLPDLPIVYMSGDSAFQRQAHGLPNSIFMMKPFRVTQLLDNLKDVLAKRSCSMSTG